MSQTTHLVAAEATDATDAKFSRPAWLTLAIGGITAALVAGALVGCRDSDEDVITTQAPADGVLVADVSANSAAVRQAVTGTASPTVAFQPQSELVNADTLKRQALVALRDGAFDRTQTLLDEAINLRPDDPDLKEIGTLIAAFQERQAGFDAQRQKAYDRQLRDVKLLQENGYRSYAINAANNARSYLPEDEVEAFPEQQWVQELIGESEKLAHQYEEQGEWLRAMRVWGDLSAIERLNHTWYDNLQAATLRVRLLATYAPDVLIDLRDRTQAERDAVEKLLQDDRDAESGEPTTRPTPTTNPATQPAGSADAEELDDSFKTDWRDSLKGITLTMLRDAIVNAHDGYVIDASYRDMLVGGIDATIALATTPGLEQAFPTLDDDTLRLEYINGLEAERRRLLEIAPGRIDRDTVSNLLDRVSALNNRSLALQKEVIVSEFAAGAFGELDQFTSMIWPSQVAEFRKGTQGNFVGVGIQIRSEPSGDLRVVSPLPGGPAAEAGIRYGDVITRINGKSAHGINDTQAVEVITGEPGTDVTLTIKSEDGTVLDYVLTRRSINVRSVTGWKQNNDGSWNWMVDPAEKIGYVKIKNFQSSTADELAEALRDLQRGGATGIVLDLRYNPGGLLQSAVDVSDRFLEKGTIVSMKGQRENAREEFQRARRQSSDIDLPVIVLVNEYSASASEIVSGALKDLNRALIVGERTFGKGSVQMLYPLGRRGGSDEAWLKLTTKKYYLPGGTSIHKDVFDTDGWGVEPDVVVDMTPRQMIDSQLARQQLDVLRDDDSVAVVKVGEDQVETDAEQALFENDAQLSAALLLLRIQEQTGDLLAMK